MYTAWCTQTCTTPYHPQSDEQVERFNCTLTSMLSNYIRTQPQRLGCAPPQGSDGIQIQQTRGDQMYNLLSHVWARRMSNSGSCLGAV